MARLTNVGAAVDVYRPAGHGDSLAVDAGQILEVQGDVIEEQEDCYIIGKDNDPGNIRAFPKAQWKLEAAPAPSPAPSPSPSPSPAPAPTV